MSSSQPASCDPNLGRVLRNRYRLESKLGQGGMGVVYRGLQLPINRPVAVKLMLPGPPGEQFMREQRFRREAEATASLREEHSVRVFDYGVTTFISFAISRCLESCWAWSSGETSNGTGDVAAYS